MFDVLLAKFLSDASLEADRAEGVAFLKAAKDLYRLTEITYVCANIPAGGRRPRYVHCYYSDTCIKQFTGNDRLSVELPPETALRSGSNHCDAAKLSDASNTLTLAVPLRAHRAEAALFGLTAVLDPANSRSQELPLLREFRILANYFHGHILRINGIDSEQELLISARELDCLKWTAAGKTAWEASVILGISERTVRFHLNAAREKLSCATTTQAVAKAVANQLIDPS